jgi:hypothetical protein
MDLSKLLENKEQLLELLTQPGGEHVAAQLVKLSSKLERLQAVLRDRPYLSYIPHPSQEPFHRSDKRGRGYFAGNRAGKSTAGNLEAYAHALGYRPWLPESDPDYRVRYKVTDLEGNVKEHTIKAPNVGRIYITDYGAWDRDVGSIWERWIPRSEYRFVKNSQQNVKKIVLSNRSVIYVMTREMDDIMHEGGEVNWVFYNEPPKFPHFKAAQTRLIDTNGPWWICCTLIEEEPWVYDYIWEKGKEDLNIEVIQGSTEDNLKERGGVLDRASIDEVTKFFTKAEAEARISGRPIFASGRIFKMYQGREPWFIDPIPIGFDWPRFMAIDPHPRKPFGVLWCAVDPYTRTCFVVDELYSDDIRNIDEFAAVVQFVEKKKLRSLRARDGDLIDGILNTPEIRWIDPSATTPDPISGSTIQHELVKRNILCNTWTKAHKDTRITTAKSWLSVRDNSNIPSIVIFNNCERLDWELRHYYWDPKSGKPVKDKDDLIDCLLAFVSSDVISLAHVSADAREDRPRLLTPQWGPPNPKRTDRRNNYRKTKRW